MLTTLLGIALSIVLSFVFFSLMLRSLRAGHALVRLTGGLLGGVLALAFAALAVAALVGVWRLDAPRAAAAPAVQVEVTPERVAQGRALATLCAECHSMQGELPPNGALTNYLSGAFPLGEIYAPNLTMGGPLKDWSDGEIVRAIREGYDRTGRPLLLTPPRALRALSDDDVYAIVAYLRSETPLRHDQRPRNPSMLAHVIAGVEPFLPSALTVPHAYPVAQ